MALVALYLGKTVLVVGDHEQVSPSAVGQDLGVIQNLIFQYLRGVPNSDLYDGQISISTSRGSHSAERPVCGAFPLRAGDHSVQQT